jgi:hypothetical protein
MQRSAAQSYSGWSLETAAFPNRFGSSASHRMASHCSALQGIAGHGKDIRQGFGLSKSHCEIYQASKYAGFFINQMELSTWLSNKQQSRLPA